MKDKPIFSFDPGKNKRIFVGIFKDGIFYRTVKPEHYMITRGGYGFQEDVVQQLIKLQCYKIIITTPDEELRFDFEKILKYKSEDFGHGEQRFLPISEADSNNDNQMKFEE